MTTVRRQDFVQSLDGKSVDVASARQDPRLRGVAVERADRNGDGKVSGRTEADALFTEVDRFDRDGNRGTVKVVDAMGQPNAVAGMVAALSQAARPSGPPAPGVGTLRDAALSRGFTSAVPLPVQQGARGPQVVALQYTLGRLGMLSSLADGAFGSRTRAAVVAFQASAQLPQTGSVDAATLSALDAAISSADLRAPAARAANPLQALSEFAALGLSKVNVQDRSQALGWSHPELQSAYGTFVGEYWDVLKRNHVEADCKTLALFFMDQFRAKVLEDVGVQLPRPRSASGSLPAGTWSAMTAARPGGFFSRFERLPQIRAGYSAAMEVQRLDPTHSMIYGVNVRFGGVDANAVARAATGIGAWSPAQDNRGDRSKVEVDLQAIQPGHLVFIDHTGDGKFDHTVNVVAVERDAAGKVQSLRLAVGSFDDMKDADGTTAPAGLQEVNNYAEEVTVGFDAQGRVRSSEVTWSSEPSYVSQSRYSAATTLMELKPGGVLKLARWG